jgi:hypothetical protein
MPRSSRAVLALPLALAVAGCSGGSSGPTTPGPAGPQLRIVYRASTTLRPDLPPAAQGCARAESPTHVHPSWRDYAAVNMTAVGPDRWEVAFTDAPPNVRLVLVVIDPNECAENLTGSVTRNVFANDVLLTDVQTIPGTQPPVSGLAFTVGSDNRVLP